MIKTEIILYRGLTFVVETDLDNKSVLVKYTDSNDKTTASTKFPKKDIRFLSHRIELLTRKIIEQKARYSTLEDFEAELKHHNIYYLGASWELGGATHMFPPTLIEAARDVFLRFSEGDLIKELKYTKLTKTTKKHLSGFGYIAKFNYFVTWTESYTIYVTDPDDTGYCRVFIKDGYMP